MNKIDEICDAIELVPGLICSYDNNIQGTVMKKDEFVMPLNRVR